MNFFKKLILILGLLMCFNNVIEAQTLNDGGIRLRVWIHKLWANASCWEDNFQGGAGADHVFKDIQVRVPNGSGGFEYSRAGLTMYFEGEGSNHWMDMNDADVIFLGGLADLFFPKEDPATKGRKIYDRTFNGKQVPADFGWKIGEYYEKDGCNFGGLFNDLLWPIYQPQNIFTLNPLELCLDGDDNHIVNAVWKNTNVSFRATPPGQVGYLIGDHKENSGLFSSDEKISVMFAYQWDWVKNFPSTCYDEQSQPFQAYQDGPINVQARITRLWSDSDYDASFYCGPSFGDEELRLRYRAKDNLSPSYSPWIVGPERSTGGPGWVSYGPLSNNMTWNYSANDSGFYKVDLQFEVWEDDGCGPSDQYNTGCINSDDIFAAGSATLDWRNSVPNTWSGINLPIRMSSSNNSNWTVGVEYKWTYADPAASIADGGNYGTGTKFDRTLCALDESTTIYSNHTNAYYYQWQRAKEVTGPDTDPNGFCGPDIEWQNIGGEVCPTFTPPQTRGTRIYRLKVMNRNGDGSQTSSGDAFAESYSECVRVTYFPFTPEINSAVCNTAVFGGSIHNFYLPTPPEEGSFVNYDSIVWTLTKPNGTLIPTTITYPNGDDYSASITMPSDPSWIGQFVYATCEIYYNNCSQTKRTVKCRVKIAPESCGYIHVDPINGDDLDEGGPTTPKKDLAQAVAVVDENTYHIRLLGGQTYTVPSLQQIDLKDNTVIEGGFEYGGGNNWRKNAASGRAIVNINSQPIDINSSTGHRVGIIADGVKNWALFDLELNMSNIAQQTSDGRGMSNYGILISNCDSFVIKNCVIRSGNAGNGNGGTSGTNGAPGLPGGIGSPGECDVFGGTGSGGAGGAGANPVGTGIRQGGRGGNGGRGGDGYLTDWDYGSYGGSGSRGASGNASGGAGGAGGITSGGSEGNGGTGSVGSVGTTGFGYAAGNRPATAVPTGAYFVPNNTAENGQDGYGGGGGGGGAGGNGQGVISLHDGGWGGSGGGSGGQGGTGGTGAKGGGSSIAVYQYNSTNGEISNVSLITGNAGQGGTGGTGGNGGNGGVGGPWNNNSSCEGGNGGQGGRGGNGGSGGRGRDGANGYKWDYYIVGGGGVQNWPGTAVNNTNVVTVNYFQGCTYSEIEIKKQSNATWQAFDVGGFYVDDLTDNISSYNNTDNTVLIYFDSTELGDKDITTNLETYSNYIYIERERDRPIIENFGNRDTLIFCGGGDLDLASTIVSASQTEVIEWDIERITGASCTIPGGGPCAVTGANISPFPFDDDVEDPGMISFPVIGTDAITYQIKLRVLDRCCGWSVPVYKYVIVAPEQSPNEIYQPAPNEFCSNSVNPTIIDGSTITGGDGNPQYQWQVNVNDSAWTDVGGIDTLEDYDPPVLTILDDLATYYEYRRIATGICEADTSNSIFIILNPGIDNNFIIDTSSLCTDNTIQLFGSAPTGGGGNYTYLWQIAYGAIPGSWLPAQAPNDGIDHIEVPSPEFPAGSIINFRRIVTSLDGLCNDTSNIVPITIYEKIENNEITSEEDIIYCFGDYDPGVITATEPPLLTGGNGSFNYLWLYNPNGIGFTLAPGDSSSISYSPGLLPVIQGLPTTYQFVRVVNSDGCSTFSDTVTITLVPAPDADTIPATVCDGSTYLLPSGTQITPTNNEIYFDTITGSSCDSLVAFEFTLNQTYSTTIAETSCNPADTGIQVTTLQSILGCDSVITTITSLLPSYDVSIAATSCNPADTGIAVASLTNFFGCDSIVTTTTSLLPSYDIQLTGTTCSPADSGYTVNNLTSSLGCDSIITTYKELLPSYDILINQDICFGFPGTQVFNFTTYQGCDSTVTVVKNIISGYDVEVTNESCNPADTGSVVSDLTASNGCDSVVTTITTLIENYDIQIIESTCNPADTGTIVNNFTSSLGCDSTITTTTTLLESYDILITSSSCNPVDTGTMVTSLTSSLGCDSIITTSIILSETYDIQLTLESCNPADTGTIVASLTSVQGCDSVVTTTTFLLESFDIQITTESCNPADTGVSVVNLTSSLGCDSMVTTLTSLVQSYDIQITENSCNPADTGSVVTNFTSSLGCDSTVTTITSLNESYDITLTESSCNPADTGTSVSNLTSALGCDSSITTITSLIPSYDIQIVEQSCNVADTGTVVNNFTSALGCDSTVTTTTSLIETYDILITETSCQPADTGTVVNNFTSSLGCDSIVTTTTILLASYDIHIDAESCSPADTGTAVNNLTSSAGCDSTVTIVTTLVQSYDVQISEQSCSAADTGTVVSNFTSTLGCDSVVTVTTSLIPAYAIEINETSCNPADTGTAITNLTSSLGCDSIVTTITSLLTSYDIEILEQSCNESDTGTVVSNFTSTLGCDSIVTIITSLNPSYDLQITNQSCLPADTGVVTTNFTTALGCDSVVTVTTALIESYDIEINNESCNPADTGTTVTQLTSSLGCDSTVTTITSLIESFDIQIADESCNPSDTGTFVNNLTSIFGCDSTVTTIVSLIPSYDILINDESCNPSDTGTFVNNFIGVNGCDSIVTSVIALIESYDIFIVEESCFPADTGVTIQSLTSQAGCDSIVTTFTLLADSYDLTYELESCNPADTGVVVLNLSSSQGCDSTVTLITALIESYDITILAESCSPLDTGMIVETFTSSFGCDSTVTTFTTLANSYDITLSGESCNPADTGHLVLNLSSINGCDSTVTVTTSLVPGAEIFIIDTLLPGEDYVLPDGSVVNEPGEYSTVLLLDNGCDSTINITLVEDIELMFDIPTVFTPNNDGVNDVFYVYTNYTDIASFEMTVFDRIGELVYSSDNIEEGWDGTFKDKPVNSGIFIVVIDVTVGSGEETKLVQSVKLVR